MKLDNNLYKINIKIYNKIWIIIKNRKIMKKKKKVLKFNKKNQ
jgi:hypothetical protein